MMPKLFRVGQPGDPTLRVRGLGSYGPAPLRVHGVNPPLPGGFRGFGAPPPGPNGGPGNALYPYGEQGLWGDGSTGGSQPLTNPPDIGAPSPAQANPPPPGSMSSPLGESDRDWINPNTYATIPLNGSTSSNQPVLSLNFKRSSLIIQNTSTATSPDVAPTLYIGFNATPIVGGSLALAPGLGFFWSASDVPPRDSIYVAFAGGVGATATIFGCVVQGTYTPVPTAASPMNAALYAPFRS